MLNLIKIVFVSAKVKIILNGMNYIIVHKTLTFYCVYGRFYKLQMKLTNQEICFKIQNFKTHKNYIEIDLIKHPKLIKL